jgi:flagellar basal-body rod modification protein FlgD
MHTQTSNSYDTSAQFSNVFNTMANAKSGDAASKTAAGNPSDDLQSTFLRLLITQLQNQDPTNPMDPSQMTSQLAQINTVSGIAQLNMQLSALSAQLLAGQQTQAVQLIGSTVLAPGNTTTVADGKSSGFGVQLDKAVDNLEIVVRNSAGQIVDTLKLGKQPAGTTPVAWDPKDAAGNPLPDDTYTFKATATTNGQQSNAKTLAASVVQGVIRQQDGTFALALSNGTTARVDDLAAVV